MHIAKGKPSPNATKIWLTKSGGCIVANNGSKIPSRELNELLEFISAQFFLICSEWRKFFLEDEIHFYC
ncbi:MAG: DUF4160 domain-containing protein [Enterocloster clostridioformis]|nr:DUF4160 domain-containing protein [Enterocloster clostridioformis]